MRHPQRAAESKGGKGGRRPAIPAAKTDREYENRVSILTPFEP